MVDRRLVGAAAGAFLLSRGLLLLLLLLGSQTAFLRKVYGDSVWETRIDLRAERVMPELARVAMSGDAWWYRSIAIHGYGPRADANGVPNYAFFPLYPLLVRTIAITGEFAIDGMILSNVAFAAALLLLGTVALRSGLAIEDAQRAIFYLAFFPASYFFSLPLTESLFLALSLASILGAFTTRWWIAGLFGALAALTRFAGILVLIPLVILFFGEPATGNRQRATALHLLWLALVPAGTAAFMAHLYRVSGDALAFVHVQQVWGRAGASFWIPILRYLRNPQLVSEPWNFMALNLAAALLLFIAGAALLIQRRWAYAAYTFASVLLPLFTGSLQSLLRYASVVFPLFFWMSVAGRRPLLDRVMVAISIALWGWLVAMLVLRIDYALA